MKMNLRLSLCLGALIVNSAQAYSGTNLTVPKFVEETKSSGVRSVYAGEWQYMVGGGVATFDCSGDGFPDLFLAGGEKAAHLYRNSSKQGSELHFEQQKSGLEFDQVTGTYPIDVDSDGMMDLVVLRVGENIVMRGLGNCKFERANEAWNFNGGDAWSIGFAATFEHGAVWPTLAVGNYIDRKQEALPWGSCTDNWLHRPDPTAMKFGAPIALKPSFCSLSMLFTDWNKSGTPSLRVSNDREYYQGGQEQLWHIEPGKEPALYNDKDGWKFVRIWGMGIASYDLNFDGYPEYFLSSMADSRLQSLTNVVAGVPPKPDFSEGAFAKGVTAHKPYAGTDERPSTGWHTQFEDVNNDRLVDLFIAKGNVDRMPDFAQRDPNNLLLQGADGKFTEVGDKAGIASFATGRGAALVDFNLDGKLDLVVVNRRENAKIWRNVSQDLGHWIEVRLEQPAPNVDAIGAWVEIKNGDKIMRREMTVGGGHASGSIGWQHFGMGGNSEAELRVMWPDGKTGEWQKLASDQFYILKKDQAAVTWKQN
jgi:enediyne biosynthesis protein E4